MRGSNQFACHFISNWRHKRVEVVHACMPFDALTLPTPFLARLFAPLFLVLFLISFSFFLF